MLFAFNGAFQAVPEEPDTIRLVCFCLNVFNDAGRTEDPNRNVFERLG